MNPAFIQKLKKGSPKSKLKKDKGEHGDKKGKKDAFGSLSRAVNAAKTQKKVRIQTPTDESGSLASSETPAKVREASMSPTPTPRPGQGRKEEYAASSTTTPRDVPSILSSRNKDPT